MNILVFCAFIILLISFIGSSSIDIANILALSKDVQHYENFDNGSDVRVYDSNNNGVVLSDRLLYFKIGLANFFTQHDGVLNLNQEDFMKWIKDKVFIWPSYQDLCCKSLQVENDDGKKKIDCNCDNINLSIFSCPEKRLIIYNEPHLNNIEGSVGASNTDNCNMSILGNEYFLLKRSIILRMTEPITEHGLTQNKFLKLKVDGRLTSVVFSRPMFVSFNTAGLFRIIHEDARNPTLVNDFDIKKDANAFAYFDSNKTTGNIILLKKIRSDELGEKQVFNFSRANILHANHKTKANYPCTIYYLSYHSEIKLYDASSSVINFVFDEKIYNENFRFGSMNTYFTNKNDTKFVEKIVIEKKSDNTLSFQLDNTEYNIPSDFAYTDPAQYSRFHIFFTIAYNIILIHCCAVENVTKKHVFISARYHHDKKFEMRKDHLLSSMQDQSPLMHEYITKKLSQNMNVTCIPNYALLANALGYSM